MAFNQLIPGIIDQIIRSILTKQNSDQIASRDGDDGDDEGGDGVGDRDEDGVGVVGDGNDECIYVSRQSALWKCIIPELLV